MKIFFKNDEKQGYLTLDLNFDFINWVLCKKEQRRYKSDLVVGREGLKL